MAFHSMSPQNFCQSRKKHQLNVKVGRKECNFLPVNEFHVFLFCSALSSCFQLASFFLFVCSMHFSCSTIYNLVLQNPSLASRTRWFVSVMECNGNEFLRESLSPVFFSSFLETRQEAFLGCFCERKKSMCIKSFLMNFVVFK